VGVVALDLHGSVGHAVYGLVDDDCGVGLFHYFVDLVAFGADEK
jgi:hypothetical protein